MQSPDYALKHFLPYPVDKDKGKAQFDSDKHILSVTVRSYPFNIFIVACDKENHSGCFRLKRMNFFILLAEEIILEYSFIR